MALRCEQGVMLLAAVQVEMFEDRDTEQGGFYMCVGCAAESSMNVLTT